MPVDLSSVILHSPLFPLLDEPLDSVGLTGAGDRFPELEGVGDWVDWRAAADTAAAPARVMAPAAAAESAAAVSGVDGAASFCFFLPLRLNQPFFFPFFDGDADAGVVGNAATDVGDTAAALAAAAVPAADGVRTPGLTAELAAAGLKPPSSNPWGLAQLTSFVFLL